MLERPPARREHQRRGQQREPGAFQHRIEQGAVNRDQRAVERIGGFLWDAPTDQVAHEHRDQRHREARGSCHGVGLGVGQRREQPPFLGLQSEHRNEAQGDDEQREKQRRPDLGRGLTHHAPAWLTGQRLAGVLMGPALQVFVGVFDHHHRRIHHGTDGNRNAAQRHHIGIHALLLHDDERHENAQRQRDDGHQRAAQVKQKRRADQRHHQELLEQLEAQVAHRTLDQAGAVVHRHDLHPCGQPFLQLDQLGLHRPNRVQCVLARAHHDHATGRFALAIQFTNAAPHFRPQLHPRHITQRDHDAGGAAHQRDGPEIVQRAQVAVGPHRVLGFAELNAPSHPLPGCRVPPPRSPCAG